MRGALPAQVSQDNVWARSVHSISEKEHGLSLDLRLTSFSKSGNDLVF